MSNLCTTLSFLIVDIAHVAKKKLLYRMNRRLRRSFPYPQPYPQSVLVFNLYHPRNAYWGCLQITAIPPFAQRSNNSPSAGSDYPLFRRVRKAVVKKTGNVGVNVILRRLLAHIVALESNTYYILRVCVCSLSYPECNSAIFSSVACTAL